MKSRYLSLLMFFIAFNSCSQNAESLKTATQKLYDANYLMDFEAITQLTYPKVVESIGKTAFLEETEFEYENEEYRLRYQLQSVPFKFGPIKKINDKSFCVITCRNPVRYFFEKKVSDDVMVNAHTIWLEDDNNTRDIVFEPKRNSFNVKRNSIFLAIMDENTNGEWKFFNLDNAKEWGQLRKLFGENIIIELGLNK